jgi:hypothetical protein
MKRLSLQVLFVEQEIIRFDKILPASQISVLRCGYFVRYRYYLFIYLQVTLVICVVCVPANRRVCRKRVKRKRINARVFSE